MIRVRGTVSFSLLSWVSVRFMIRVKFGVRVEVSFEVGLGFKLVLVCV